MAHETAFGVPVAHTATQGENVSFSSFLTKAGDGLFNFLADIGAGIGNVLGLEGVGPTPTSIGGTIGTVTTNTLADAGEAAQRIIDGTADAATVAADAARRAGSMLGGILPTPRRIFTTLFVVALAIIIVFFVFFT